MKAIKYISFCMMAMMAVACRMAPNSQTDAQVVFENGYYPYCTLWQGKYYYTMQIPSADSIVLYANADPKGLAKGERKCVWHDSKMMHIWSPELHRLSSKWYIYFEADGGNTDDHQLYVLENLSDDPMKGEFKLMGVIKTNDEWNFGLHPTSIVVQGQQYLLWSGWQHRRSETETQCIYIARMENPWTLSSERVLLSKPDLEWERQWINPDGTRSNYPIFVNENPEAFVTKDGRYVCVCYSASGIWTVYHALGMLYARIGDDLLNPQSWTKVQEPLFKGQDDNPLYGTSNVSIVPSSNGQDFLLYYEALWNDEQGNNHRDVRLKDIGWDKNGLPDFGQP